MEFEPTNGWSPTSAFSLCAAKFTSFRSRAIAAAALITLLPGLAFGRGPLVRPILE